MLARLLSFVLTILLACALAWTATILWWRSSHRMPTATDVVTHLFLLPAGLMAACLVLQRVIGSIRVHFAGSARMSQRGVTSAELPHFDASQREESPADDTTLTWRAAVIGCALHTSFGPDPKETAAAAVRQQRPDLVDLLKDGAPIFVARAADLDVGCTRQLLERAQTDLQWRDEALRTVALAADVAERMLFDTLQRLPLLDECRLPSIGPCEAPTLSLVLLLPSGWTPDAASAAAHVVRARLSDSWPPDRLALAPRLAGSEADALTLVDDAVLALHRQPVPALRGVIAAESHIGVQTIERLRGSNRLFCAGVEHGVTPGEGAAAILLCRADGPLKSVMSAGAFDVLLSRATLSQLSIPTADRGRANTAALDHAVKDSLALLSSEPPNPPGAHDGSRTRPVLPVCVTADLCPHPVRTSEVARVIAERLGQLDFSCDLLPLGAPCGHTGCAGALLAIVLAHQQCKERAGTVLAMSVADPRQRGVIALLPSPLPGDA
ncbi:hypothetical protein [Paracidovorax citrulli]